MYFKFVLEVSTYLIPGALKCKDLLMQIIAANLRVPKAGQKQVQFARFPHPLCPKSTFVPVSLSYLECEDMQEGLSGAVGPVLTKTPL